MLLSIAYGVLALLLVTAVVSASSVHLERKRLLALADLSALAAADALDTTTYFDRAGRSHPDDQGGLLVLTPSSVHDSVEAHLGSSAEAASFSGLAVLAATTQDGRTAEVTLGAVARPPLLSWVTAPWSDGIQLQATARARAG